MISIIICSRNSKINSKLEANIKITIGVEYELIIIDNSNNKYSIFQAYNEGVQRSKFEYLCFMHEDVFYQTHEWGKNVIEYFHDQGTGMIALAGGHCILNTPSSWWFSRIISANLLQGNSNTGESSLYKKRVNENNLKSEVAAIDGFWFCIPKKLFNNIKFDDQLFNSFHFYDMDISFQISKLNLKIYVIYDILIEHFSKGKITNDWLISADLFYDKWKSDLPKMCGINIETIDSIPILTELSHSEFSYIEQLIISEENLNKIAGSKSYKLGKMILKPLKWIKNKYDEFIRFK